MLRRFAACVMALAALCFGRAAFADTRLWVFAQDAPPQALRDTAMAVSGESVTVKLTFAGDCTLGDDDQTRGRRSFSSTVGREGMAYPFAGLLPLFGEDDFTIVNLEGVLSDSDAGKVRKQYNFLGDAAYTEILTLGSVECAGLANNHSRDYGKRGERETKAALDAAGIGWFDESTLCVLEKDGVRVGLTGSLFGLGGSKAQRLKEQIDLLGELGCAATVHVTHAGNEYQTRAGAGQERAAAKAVALGAALVVGHHPHIVQNVELVSGAPVVYSLGNCCFGGNLNPKDKSALLLQAELTFTDGALSALSWTLWPISVSGADDRNDFQPRLLAGDEARAVIERVQAISDTALAPYMDGMGARQNTIDYK